MVGLLSALVGDAEVESFFRDEAEIAALLRVEAMLAEATAEAGLIEKAAAAKIVATWADFIPDLEALAEGLVRDGVPVPDLVRQLRAAVGEPYAASLHFGATSQDIVDTAFMLRMRRACSLLDARLASLLVALDAIAGRDGGRPLMAVTRMQDALPFTVADKIATWTAPLVRHAARLGDLGRSHFVVQLGGPVGDGSSFDGKADEVRVGLARRLGLADAPPWHSQRDRIADIAHVLAGIGGTLGKIGQDITLMAQNPVGAVVLVGGGKSSAMAHKSNPVGAEVLVALARFSAGLNGTLGQAMVHENERSGAAWTLEWMILPQIVVATGASLRIGAGLISGLRFTSEVKPR